MKKNPDLSEDQQAQEADEADKADPRHKRGRFPIPRGKAVNLDRVPDRGCPETPGLSELVGIRGISGIKLFVRNEPDEVDDQPDFDVDGGPAIDLYDEDEIRRKLGIKPSAECLAGSDVLGEQARSTNASEALAEWDAKLRDILDDPRGPRRQLIVADDPLLDRLSSLHAECPGFAQVIDLILRAAHLSQATGSPLRLPAMLLAGPAGIGKTHFARRLAGALGVPMEFICGDLLSDRGTITGLNTSWRAAKAGRVAAALLDSTIASPLFVIDEVDKVSPIHIHENPLAFLHTVLEAENAQKFCDEYLSFSLRADHCFWILTANETESLLPSILDRLLVLTIKPPDQVAMAVIARNIYRDANARQANWFSPEPSEEFIAVLVRHNPRKASRIMDYAMGFAAADGRRDLSPEDAAAAAALLEGHESARRKAGFLAP